jgi:hypothetical protein
MTISREQHAQRNAIRSGIIAAMRDNLDDEFTAAEICDAMTAPIDRDPRIVGANLKIMASEGLVESRPRQNIHVYRLLPAALDWRPPAFHRAPKVNPGYQRPASTPPPSPAPAAPLPVESREDEAPARAPETPRGAQTIRKLMWSVPEYAALKPPIDWTDEPDALPAQPFKAHGLPPGFTLAEPDQPIETPQTPLHRLATMDLGHWEQWLSNQPLVAVLNAQPDQTPETPPANQSAATDIHLNSLPDRWLPELRLRLLGDGEGMPEIILHVHTEGGGAFWTMRTRGPVTFDPGEAAFLPTLGDALCQFINHISPPTPAAPPYGAHKDQP